MAYYFMVEEKKGKYEPIIIDNSSNYKISKKQYVKPGAYGLKEIDMFTTLFENEIELREALFKDGLLNSENRNRQLSIRFFNKNTYNKVKHDLLYKKDLQYIQNPTLIWKLVMEKFNQEDYYFIEKLASYFSHHYECANTALEVMHGAMHSLHSGKKHEILYRSDLNGDLLISRLIKLILYKSYTDYNGYTIYKNEVNHRNLHAIIAFINNYYKDDEPKVEKQKIEPIETKTKTLKKSKEIEGQMKIEF